MDGGGRPVPIAGAHTIQDNAISGYHRLLAKPHSCPTFPLAIEFALAEHPNPTSARLRHEKAVRATMNTYGKKMA